MENQTNNWTLTWNKSVPYLALIGPTSLFIASLFLAAGIGVMPDKTYTNSSHEGFIMTLGAPFFIATFIFLGQTIAKRFLRVGILVTVLGILGASSLVFLSSMRLLQKAFIDSGFDSNTVWAAWDNVSVWHIPLLLQNIAAPLAFIIGGIALLMTKFTPKWVAVLLIICFPFIATGQLIGKIEIFWTLGTAMLTISVWGLVKANKSVKA
jgi:hypothetical protein